MATSRRRTNAVLATPQPAPASPAETSATGPAACGIDEAGRGPVLGPLVVAGVAGDDLELFRELGCRDSKKLTPDRRRAIDRQLRKQAGVRIVVRVVEADRLDAEMARDTLNVLEMTLFREVGCELGARHVFADAADVKADRFARQLAEGLPAGIAVTAEHRADDTYPIVGAASIVAKVARDKAVAKLATRLERQLPMKLGSGYCHDESTQLFLAEWVRRFGDVPEGTRRRWQTTKDLLAPKSTRLEAFAVDARRQ